MRDPYSSYKRTEYEMRWYSSPRRILAFIVLAHMGACYLLKAFWSLIVAATGDHYVSQMQVWGIVNGRWVDAPLVLPTRFCLAVPYEIDRNGAFSAVPMELYGHIASYLLLSGLIFGLLVWRSNRIRCSGSGFPVIPPADLGEGKRDIIDKET